MRKDSEIPGRGPAPHGTIVTVMLILTLIATLGIGTAVAGEAEPTPEAPAGDGPDAMGGEDNGAEATTQLHERRNKLRVATTVGWLSMGVGLGMLGTDLVARSRGGDLTPMGAMGSGFFGVTTLVSTLVSAGQVRNLPTLFRPRPARVVANVLCAAGAGLFLGELGAILLGGIFWIFTATMVDVFDEAALLTVAVIGGSLMTASSIVGHIDNEVLIGQIDEDLYGVAAGGRTRIRPRLATVPLPLAGGVGAAVIGVW